jgi:hypothetical protein
MTIFVTLATDFMIRAISARHYSHKIQSSQSPTSTASPSDPHTPPLDPENETKTHSNTPRSPADLKRVQLLLISVAFASLMIYIRGIYRSIELAQGWSGYVIRHEVFFIWLDGFVMVLCLASFAVGWVGFLLPRRTGWKKA